MLLTSSHKKTWKRKSDVQYLTWLNIISAFGKLWLVKKDKSFTFFLSCYGHYEYLVVLFGLSNSLVSFQNYINNIPLNYWNIIYIVLYWLYFDLQQHSKEKKKLCATSPRNALWGWIITGYRQSQISHSGSLASEAY